MMKMNLMIGPLMIIQNYIECMIINLYKKIIPVFIPWEDCMLSEPNNTYIRFDFVIKLNNIPYFRVCVPNKSFNHWNPFVAILTALESESVGMIKYDRLKERVRCIGVWQHL